MDNPKDAKPLEMPPVLAHVQAAVDKLAACETIKAAIEAVKRDDEKRLLIKLLLLRLKPLLSMKKFVPKTLFVVWKNWA